MTTPRLPFLRPTLLRSLGRSSEGSSIPRHAHCPRLRSRPPQHLRGAVRAAQRSFGTTTRGCVRVDASPTQRYGTANEPMPPPKAAQKDVSGRSTVKAKSGGPKQQTAKAKAGGAKGDKEEAADRQSQQKAPKVSGDVPKASPTMFETENVTAPPITANPPPPTVNGDTGTATSAYDKNDATTAPENDAAAGSGGEVMRMPPPSPRKPHLTTPPYVHHFDTWSLVKQLSASGFDEAQSISIMKSIRLTLNQNMEMARAGLVSQSDVENETYLFRAACSELHTEVSNNRKAENERMLTQRNQLQHEVDILGQRLGQETGNLKDELKGMFDDRKMAVRQEQRSMETKVRRLCPYLLLAYLPCILEYPTCLINDVGQIQELNYKITVALNSDARSEVEGLRWIITRRAVTALVIVAAAILATLRYSSYMTHTQAADRSAMNTKTKTKNGGPSPTSSSPAGSAATAAANESHAGNAAAAAVAGVVAREDDDAHGNSPIAPDAAGGGGSNGTSSTSAYGTGDVYGGSAAMRALEQRDGGAGDGVIASEGGVSLG
ncbi:hypothetical protein IWX92DRAFT_145019 [Phyllosticta citricarpa]